MKKISMIAVLTTVLALFGSGLSYAVPTQAEPLLEADISQVALTPELVTQAITELKTAGVPHETFYDARGVKTTFHFEQGLSFDFVEPTPSVSALVSGCWRFMYGPYVDFTKFEQGLITSGMGWALGRAVCLIPGVGWAACVAVELVFIVAGQIASHHGCPRDLRVYLYGGPNGCL